MMRDYLIAMLAIPVLLFVWLAVQRIVREFALRHPEFGPPREEGGCGSSCGCSGKKACKNRNDHDHHH